MSQDVETRGRRGLPFLGGLPVLGRLFTSPTRDNRQVDIVIAVTPRVLRAPALTPRDEEMRPSGTLQSPTTGSLEAMLIENAREEQILNARRLPKEPVIQLPDAPSYVPAAKADTSNQANATQPTTVAQNSNGAPAKTEPAVTTSSANAANAGTGSPETAMPQPKAATDTNKLDVATAIKNVITPATNVTSTAAPVKSNAEVSAPVEDLAPKSAVADTTVKEPPPAIIEMALAAERTELVVGEKGQLTLELNSGAPLGLSVIMLRFDPNVLKVTNVTAGKLFTDPKTAPAITLMKNEAGVLLVSIAPAAVGTIAGEGALLNVEFEGLANGDTSIAFDLSNVHVVTSDGSGSVLQLSSPMKLSFKPAAPQP